MEPEITIPLDARLLEIATSLEAASSEMERLRPLIVARLDTSQHQGFDAAWSTEKRAAHLASTYQREFQEALNDRYGEPMLASVERIIGDAASTESHLGESLNRERDETRNSRRTAGRWFVGWGIVLIFSNLIVIPAMAWCISRFVEHPAALAVRSLEEHLTPSQPGQSNNGEGAGKTAAAAALKVTAQVLDNVRSLSEGVANLERLAATEKLNVPGLPAYESFAKLHQETSKLPATEGAYELVYKAGEEEVRAAHDLTRTIELIGGSMQVYQSGAAPQYIRFDGSTRWHHADDYVILPRSIAPDELENAVRAVAGSVATMQQLRNNVEVHQEAVADFQTLLAEIRVPLDSLEGESEALGKASQEIAKLGLIGQDIAGRARSAMETLDSTAKFVTPYAFAVLAVGAMFVSIGVASLLRGLRVRDDSYDEAVELNRAFMLGRLACVLRSSRSGSDAILERLARTGERPRRSEGGMSMPLTRAVTELVEAINRK